MKFTEIKNFKNKMLKGLKWHPQTNQATDWPTDRLSDLDVESLAHDKKISLSSVMLF